MSSDQVSEILLLPIRRTALVGKQQGGQGGQGGQEGRRARGEILSDPVTPRCVLHRALHHSHTLHGSLGIGKFELLCSSPTSSTSRPPPLSAIARVLTGSITPATRFTQRPGVFILWSQRLCRFSIGVLRREMDSCLLICILHILPFRIVIKKLKSCGDHFRILLAQC